MSLTGTLVVARDIAHAKIKELIDAGQGIPQCVPSPSPLILLSLNLNANNHTDHHPHH